jgi:hypothetical protein
MSAFEVNQTRRDGGNDVNDPSATLADEFCCDAQQGVRSECDSFSSVSLGNREHG